MARFSAEDYARAFRAMLPIGRAIPPADAPVAGALTSAIAETFVRSDDAASNLLVDTFPATTVDLLDEWEASLGLPDPCVGDGATAAQRRAQVIARLTGGGGQSRARFISYAAALGFKISITTYAPFRVGRNAVGDALASSAWSFAWGVQVLANTGGLSVDVLMCELEAIKPAETTIILLP